MVSSTSIIQELIPQLATSLGLLRRVPGKNEAWVPQVIAALEKERDPRFERMRRRIGFAQRLGTMSGLPDNDIALTTLGLFFHELLPLKSNGVRVPRPWQGYLLRSEDWLRPAFEICEAVRNKSWEEIEDAAEIVAKIAVVYDSETLDRHERPLVVAASIVAEAEGRPAQRIVDLLWTEEGQELCDHHFKRHPRGYRLEPKEVRNALAKLNRATPRISTEFAVQSMRFGGAPEQRQRETEVGQPMAQPEKQDGSLDNFDRRRQALRTRTNDADPCADETKAHDEYKEDVPEQIDAPGRTHSETRDPDPIALKLEERMNQLATIPPTGHARGDALDVRDRLQELRIQLGQIQQIAAQAEQLLGGIAPQIDEFATRIADVEAVMDRWSGRSRAAA